MLKGLNFLFSGALAFASYCTIAFMFLLHFSYSKNTPLPTPPKFYAAKSQTEFAVDLVEITKPKEEIKPPAPQEVLKPEIKEQKVENVEIKEIAASKTANTAAPAELFAKITPKKQEAPKQEIKPDIGDLFAKITPPKKEVQKEIKKQTKEKKLQEISEDDLIAKRKKAKESSQKDTQSKAAQSLENNEPTPQIAQATQKQKGDYSAFYSEVQNILYSHWNPPRSKKHLIAKVQIIIDNAGNFSYKIEQNSGERNFDERLQKYLDIMRLRKFPKFEGGSETNIVVSFKTE